MRIAKPPLKHQGPGPQRGQKSAVPGPLSEIATLSQAGWPEDRFVARLSKPRLDIHDRWNTIGLFIKAAALFRTGSRAMGGTAELWLEPEQANRLIRETQSLGLADLSKAHAIVRIRNSLMTIECGLGPEDPIIAAALADHKVELTRTARTAPAIESP